MVQSQQSSVAGSIVPPEFAGDHIIWAAWLYFAENRTQNEVASELNVSRATIANYLTEARNRGLVSVSIAPDILGNIELGRRLAQKFKLNSAHIVPTPEDRPDISIVLRKRLGVAGARTLSSRLNPAAVVGVAWGRTMLALGEALEPRNLPDVKVVQIAGSSIDGKNSAPESCTALIASKLGAQGINFYAPAILSSIKLHDELMNEPSLVRQMKLINGANILVFGVGALDRDTRFSDSEFLDVDTVRTYLENGAIGVALGRFINIDGVEVDGPLSGRTIGMSLDKMKHVPERLMVTGGAGKAEAVHAMLKGGFVTHLVTDVKTAERLL